MGLVWVNGVLQVPAERVRLGSFVPDDLLAAVQPLGDVVLVEQHDPEQQPTRPGRPIEYDGLTAIVQSGGRVLALMSPLQWKARPPDCRWHRVPRPGEAVRLPDREPPPPPRTYVQPRRRRSGSDQTPIEY